MKELIKLLDLDQDSWMRFAVLGKCFSLERRNCDQGNCVVIKNCKDEDLMITSLWSDLANFIRGRVIDKIAINDETLYKITLIEVAIAYVNRGRPSEEVRKKRLEAISSLAKDEAFFASLMSYLDR